MAALHTSRYGMFKVSAMMKATAPMTGGIICPPMLDVASTPPANDGEYPKRFIKGMVNCPVVTTFATPEPLIVPISPELMTDTLAGPPRVCPTVPMAKSLNNEIMPACSRKAPNKMNRKM